MIQQPGFGTANGECIVGLIASLIQSLRASLFCDGNLRSKLISCVFSALPVTWRIENSASSNRLSCDTLALILVHGESNESSWVHIGFL